MTLKASRPLSGAAAHIPIGNPHFPSGDRQAPPAPSLRAGDASTLHRIITDSLVHGLYAIDCQGRVTFLNLAAERILGWEAKDLLGCEVHQAIHFQHADASPFPVEDCPLLSVLQTGKTVSADDDFFTARSGRLVPVSYTSAPVLEDGKVVGAVVVFQDMTESRRQDQAIRESEQRLHMAMEAGRMGSWEWHISTGKVIWSPGLEKMHDLEPGTFGGTFEDFLADCHPDDRDAVSQKIAETLERCTEHRIEYRLLLKTGKVRWVEGRGKVFCDSAGKPIRLIGVCIDITERKWLEESLKRYSLELEQRVQERTAELREMNTRLAASNRELQDFASVASHDLQEPLRKIQAFGDRLELKAGPALSAEGQDYLKRMKNAASRMQTLISDLLSFARITTQARPFAPVDLNEITRDVVTDLESAIEKGGGRVDVALLPMIDADPVQMRQLLQNLIANALKFRKPDRPPVVRVFSRVGSTRGEQGALIDRCQLFVEDDGIGFDEKYLDRIFNVFQRLHGRNSYEGTGIGLAVCRKIAERHGGSITARSSPGQGATFIVTLPIHHEEPSLLKRNEELSHAG